MSADDDTKSGALPMRCFAILEQLSGQVINGMANKDLAQAVGCSATNVTRATDVLRDKGWVEKDESTGRFRITTRFGRLTFRVMTAFDKAAQELDDLKRGYTLGDGNADELQRRHAPPSSN